MIYGYFMSLGGRLVDPPTKGVQMMWKFGVLGACLALVGCVDGTKADAPQEAGSDETGTGGFEPLPTSDTGTPDPAGSESDEDEDEGDGESFIVMDTDGDEPAPQCDVWTQDCPTGEKCSAYIEGGGNAWNSTKCVDVYDNPSTVGSPCTAEGASGVDDCDYGSMCWGVDEEGVGYCVALCTGNADNFICDDPDTSCVIVNGGVLNLCLPECNPLIQDCQADGESCYPAPAGFACAPDVSLGAGSGETCSGLNTCTGGTFCTEADGLPACDGPACCTSFCDTEDDDVCDNGADCLALFNEGEAPPGYETLGGCLLP